MFLIASECPPPNPSIRPLFPSCRKLDCYGSSKITWFEPYSIGSTQHMQVIICVDIIQQTMLLGVPKKKFNYLTKRMVLFHDIQNRLPPLASQSIGHTSNLKSTSSTFNMKNNTEKV